LGYGGIFLAGHALNKEIKMAANEPTRLPNGKLGLTRDINADTAMPGKDSPDSPLNHSANAEDYNHDKLEAGDLLDNVTSTFDDDINLPRV
jgi:hypothetical protein